MPKPTQIIVTPETKHSGEAIYALCEDGSIWYKANPTAKAADYVRPWIKLTSIDDKERKCE